jgi:dsRNA-specific ribonuclease
MSNAMDKSWKSRLQEYCQKTKLPSPNYRIRQQTGTSNKPKFQVSLILISNVLSRYLSFSLKSKLMDVGTLVKRIVHQRKREKIQQLKKHVLILN